MIRRSSAQPGRGFTMIEILVVIAIIALLVGLAFALPRRQMNEEAVRGAAEELAAVFRETRARAMRTNTAYAVAFNIANAPGSSGKVLNNRAGGHWYRVIGPNDSMLDQTHGQLPEYGYNTLPFPHGFNPLFGISLEGNTPAFSAYRTVISRSWASEPYQLPAKQVRFLALADQDNGNNLMPANGGWYQDTYPRPWFGWWDTATKRLYTWGGYDPHLTFDSMHAPSPQRHRARYINAPVQINGRIASPSAFYYEGYEGLITGCTNPADRIVLDDDPENIDRYPGQLNTNPAIPQRYYTLSREGESRPLIDASMLDYVIIFRSDGTVTDDWFRFRNFWCWEGNSLYCKQDTLPFVPDWPRTDPGNRPPSAADQGPGDRCSGMRHFLNFDDSTTDDPRRSQFQREATSYVDRTGYYWITLASDATNDASEFPTADAARRSLGSVYRVGVSPSGGVRVLRVASTYDGPHTFDLDFMGSNWQNKQRLWGKAIATWNGITPVTTRNYINHRPHNADMTPTCLPAYDVATPFMMEHRAWWWETP